MKKSFLQALLLFVLLIGGWAVFYVQRSARDATSAGTSEGPRQEATRFEDLVSGADASGGVREGSGDEGLPDVGFDLSALAGNPVAACARQLASTESAGARRAWLAALRRALDEAERDEAVEWILRYLASSEDVSLNSTFRVGPDGNLRDAPTFRVWLLDILGQIAPERAAALAMTMFESKASADEYALHLRNFARGNTDGERFERAVLNNRFQEMLQYEPWASDPSAGFLEAFDVPVFTDAVELLPLLSRQIANRDRDAVRRAAFMALDRLLVEHPGEGLERIVRNLEVLSSEPYVRAGSFARADLRDPAQAEMVHAYLTSNRAGREELAYFFNLVPNNNLILSPTLLSENVVYSSEDVRARFRATLSRLSDWQIDPALADEVDVIEKAKARIRRVLGE